MTDATTPSSWQELGAVYQPDKQQTTFRVWAPHATSVAVVGDFNKWRKTADKLKRRDDGIWEGAVKGAKPGEEYRFYLVNGKDRFDRIDPYARHMTNSAGNAIIYQDTFDWGDIGYESPTLNNIIIYELHVGAFSENIADKQNDLDGVIRKLDYIKELGATHIQLMPLCEFAGDQSWGYNPANFFAVETSYGGAEWVKRLVQSAHARGLGVILDVVYNHVGPSDNPLWRFDGWSENDKGGIYFYNDWRAATPWGDTRPDYGRGEVRRYIIDNVRMWLEEFKLDGLRWDAINYMRNADGSPGDYGKIDDAYSLIQEINHVIHEHGDYRLTIAEDMQRDPRVTARPAAGGLGFSTQWAAEFAHSVRDALVALDDESRNMDAIVDCIQSRYNGDPFQRVVFVESHDAVANGQARLPHEIDPENPSEEYPARRAALGAALTLTVPGVPMLFMGQEFLEDGWFEDTRPLDWEKAERNAGMVQLFRDLIHLRRNAHGTTRGLQGADVQVHHVNQQAKIVAYHRWFEQTDEPGDSTLVILNFADRMQIEYRVGVPYPGRWHVRFNSDAPVYNDSFVGITEQEHQAQAVAWDGCPYSIVLNIGSYAALILSQ